MVNQTSAEGRPSLLWFFEGRYYKRNFGETPREVSLKEINIWRPLALRQEDEFVGLWLTEEKRAWNGPLQILQIVAVPVDVVGNLAVYSLLIPAALIILPMQKIYNTSPF